MLKKLSQKDSMNGFFEMLAGINWSARALDPQTKKMIKNKQYRDVMIRLGITLDKIMKNNLNLDHLNWGWIKVVAYEIYSQWKYDDDLKDIYDLEYDDVYEALLQTKSGQLSK